MEGLKFYNNLHKENLHCIIICICIRDSVVHVDGGITALIKPSSK